MLFYQYFKNRAEAEVLISSKTLKMKGCLLKYVVLFFSLSLWVIVDSWWFPGLASRVLLASFQKWFTIESFLGLRESDWCKATQLALCLRWNKIHCLLVSSPCLNQYLDYYFIQKLKPSYLSVSFRKKLEAKPWEPTAKAEYRTNKINCPVHFIYLIIMFE